MMTMFEGRGENITQLLAGHLRTFFGREHHLSTIIQANRFKFTKIVVHTLRNQIVKFDIMLSTFHSIIPDLKFPKRNRSFYIED